MFTEEKHGNIVDQYKYLFKSKILQTVIYS